MKIPHQFQLAGATWQVVQLDKLAGDVLGLTHRDELKIELKKSLLPTVKETTFFHELLHAIKYTQGLDNHDEVEIDAFAQLLHQAMISAK